MGRRSNKLTVMALCALKFYKVDDHGNLNRSAANAFSVRLAPDSKATTLKSKIAAMFGVKSSQVKVWLKRRIISGGWRELRTLSGSTPRQVNPKDIRDMMVEVRELGGNWPRSGRQWSCAGCTFDNPGTMSECSVCQTPRPDSSAAAHSDDDNDTTGGAPPAGDDTTASGGMEFEERTGGDSFATGGSGLRHRGGTADGRGSGSSSSGGSTSHNRPGRTVNGTEMGTIRNGVETTNPLSEPVSERRKQLAKQLLDMGVGGTMEACIDALRFSNDVLDTALTRLLAAPPATAPASAPSAAPAAAGTGSSEASSGGTAAGSSSAGTPSTTVSTPLSVALVNASTCTSHAACHPPTPAAANAGLFSHNAQLAARLADAASPTVQGKAGATDKGPAMHCHCCQGALQAPGALGLPCVQHAAR